jgi:hypothetical protein
MNRMELHKTAAYVNKGDIAPALKAYAGGLGGNLAGTIIGQYGPGLAIGAGSGLVANKIFGVPDEDSLALAGGGMLLGGLAGGIGGGLFGVKKGLGWGGVPGTWGNSLKYVGHGMGGTLGGAAGLGALGAGIGALVSDDKEQGALKGGILGAIPGALIGGPLGYLRSVHKMRGL